MKNFRYKFKEFFLPFLMVIVILIVTKYEPISKHVFSPIVHPIKNIFNLIFEYLIIPPIGYLTATILTLWGIYQIKEMYKIDTKKVDWESPLQGYIKGWAAAIGFTILGILIYYFKVFGKI